MLDLGDERLVLEAPERFADSDRALSVRASEEETAGRRVLEIGRLDGPLETEDDLDPKFPGEVRPLGLAVLAERLRPNAAQTVAYFTSQGIDLKVLSGDAPATVAAIATDAGVPGTAPALDGQALPRDPAKLRSAVLSAPAVWRISPEGKRAVIDALTDGGRYVGMLGDGVNDVGALKDARLEITPAPSARTAPRRRGADAGPRTRSRFAMLGGHDPAAGLGRRAARCSAASRRWRR